MKAPRNTRGLFGRLVLIGLAIFLLSEILLRWPGHPEVRFKLADKRLHCLDERGFRILLCPNARVEFEHPFGFDYTVTTDRRGERGVYPPGRPGPGPDAPAVWIIGDSIAMGYGQSDRETFAALIARDRPDIRVRNLGVDALGAAGIRQVLETKLAASESPPVRVFWIMHMSDFIDDLNDLRLAGSQRTLVLRRAHFIASRHSAAYNLLKHLTEQLRLSRKRNVYAAAKPEAPPPDHPTFQNISAAVQDARERELELYFVFYPNVDHATGRPGDDYTLEEILKEHIGRQGGRMIDTRPAFLKAADQPLYLPIDGHPAAAASRVFARELKKNMPPPQTKGLPRNSPPRE